ncbi:LuxR C-terminal-related transcriptional regulator [Spongiactinospora rosea]|uniref:LuxR C-terminal-related transcriptional regulator n=1 Tax=Spongiactinospora rosea TaxID=2248750 RepID=UPI0018F29ECA|nr:LuxR C-terminal-related transcriptional regulator [Spongiactinospora rosea]
MAERRPGNLPAEMTSFVGRSGELAAGGRMLMGGRLLTVTGPAGVGKSRLALRVADSVRRRFPDGLWHVELSQVAPAHLRPIGGPGPAAAVAAALGRLGEHAEDGDGLAAALGDRRALLVLDTCEHLAAEIGPLVEAVLQGSPRVRVLATGRGPLGLPGERVLRLDPLPLTDPADPDPGCPSVALFAERAVAVDPDFSLDSCSLSDVAQVCRCLDGLPLAIELAAARTRSLSIPELLERLDDMTTMPGWGAHTAAPRHRDLRAAIAWSHELCRPDQRLLWEALAVIEGEFGVEAARRAVTREGVLVTRQSLDELVDRSILLRSGDPGRPGRYRMLETYRRFWLDPNFGRPGRALLGHRFGAGRWSRLPQAAAATAPAAAPQAPAPAPVRIGRPVTSTLTPRELEVAELIAEGLSNPQIAVRLLIAKRTVDAHVRNILAKGGLASRTQVAAWFAERTQWADA